MDIGNILFIIAGLMTYVGGIILAISKNFPLMGLYIAIGTMFIVLGLSLK